MRTRIIVSAVIEKRGSYLFGRKADNVGPYPNTWHLPGGGVEIGKESLENAVRREIREEAGIEVSDLKPLWFDEDDEPNKTGEMTHYLFLIFQARYKSGKLKAADDILILKWINKTDFSQYKFTRPSVKLFKKIGYL